MNETTEADQVPEPIRKRALDLSLDLVRRVVEEDGIHLDFIACCELLDMELAALYDRMNPQPTVGA